MFKENLQVYQIFHVMNIRYVMPVSHSDKPSRLHGHFGGEDFMPFPEAASSDLSKEKSFLGVASLRKYFSQTTLQPLQAASLDRLLAFFKKRLFETMYPIIASPLQHFKATKRELILVVRRGHIDLRLLRSCPDTLCKSQFNTLSHVQFDQFDARATGSQFSSFSYSFWMLDI